MARGLPASDRRERGPARFVDELDGRSATGYTTEWMEFADRGTEDIFDGVDSERARKTLPRQLHDKAQNKLAVLAFAESIDDLRAPPSNRLERLRGDRVGQHSIRINDQYRICFRWVGGQAIDVQIVDYH